MNGTALILVLLSLAAQPQGGGNPPDAAPVAPPTGAPAGPGAPTTPPAGGKPSEPVPPPYTQQPGAVAQRPARDGEMPVPYISGARQWLVQTGQAWTHVVKQAQPGDEIIFPAGFHIPQVIEGLQGTREKPIFLRSRDRIPAAVVCEQTGWVFRRCRHLVVENFLFLNPRDAAIVIESDPVPGAPADSELAQELAQPWTADITVRQCTVAGTRPSDQQDAVRVRRCQDVRLDALRVDGWNDAAVELVDARRVLVRGLMMVPAPKFPQRCGIAVRGGSGEISVTGCSFNKVIGVGVSVGSPRATGPNGNRIEPPPVERMRIDRCVFERPGMALELLNVRDLTMSRVTIVNPSEAIYAIPDDACAVEQVLIEKSIGFWFPGNLKRFSPHPDGFPPTAITLGDNLWYSRELPDAWDAIGAPFGYQSVPQVTSVDPSIDVRTLRARHGDAVRFGAFSLAVPSGTKLPTEMQDEPPPMGAGTDAPAGTGSPGGAGGRGGAGAPASTPAPKVPPPIPPR